MEQSVEKVWGLIFSEKGLPKDNKYVVAFGNSEWGKSFDTKEAFIKEYRDLLYRCWFQDMYVYYNGKLIRSIQNYGAKLTGKLMVVGLGPSQVVYTKYVKHPYKNLDNSN